MCCEIMVEEGSIDLSVELGLSADTPISHLAYHRLTMIEPVQDTSLKLEDHERLIKGLYEPGADVARISAVLTRIQRSHQGWLFADQVLQSQDVKVRFFGALTFTIKINTDWNKLSIEDAAALLQRLMTWLVRLVQAGDDQLVIRKLCSSLVAYFLKSSTSWDRCLKHLIWCFSIGSVVDKEGISQLPSTVVLLANLNALQLKTLLWFSTTLVEEVGKMNSNSIQT